MDERTVFCPVCGDAIEPDEEPEEIEQDFGPPAPAHARCVPLWYGEDGEGDV